MIKLIFRSACAGVFLGGWGLAALSLHVVRTPDRIGLIPKERLGITDTYVDARKWTLSDLSNHPELVKRVLEAGKANLFQYLSPTGGNVADQLSKVQQEAPAESADSVLGKVKDMFGTWSHAAPAQNAAAFPVDF